MTDKIEESINNTPSLEEIREMRREANSQIFTDSEKFDDVKDSPCFSCESCNFRKNVSGTISGYCKVHFETIYSSLNFARENVISFCADYELADKI